MGFSTGKNWLIASTRPAARHGAQQQSTVDTLFYRKRWSTPKGFLQKMLRDRGLCLFHPRAGFTIEHFGLRDRSISPQLSLFLGKPQSIDINPIDCVSEVDNQIRPPVL